MLQELKKRTIRAKNKRVKERKTKRNLGTEKYKKSSKMKILFSQSTKIAI